MFDKTSIADVLTRVRLFGSPFVLLPLLVMGQWLPAFAVAVILILTDAFDGIAARRFIPHRSVDAIKKGGKADEDADGMLTNALLGGLAINFIFVQHDFSWALLAKVAAVLGVMLLITIMLIVATAKLSMPWCKWADLLNGFYYGVLLTIAAAVIMGNAFGWHASALTMWVPLLGATIVGFCWFKRDRLLDRDERKYDRTPQ